MKRALSRFVALDTLSSASVAAFRESCFKPQIPIVLPRGQFQDFPAIPRWFTAPSAGGNGRPTLNSLNYAYLEQYGDCHVPLELTTTSSDGDTQLDETFRRFHAPLSLFLDWTRSVDLLSSDRAQGTASAAPSVRLYLAQCQLLDLAPPLRADFPIPAYVSEAGKGDVYDTNIWIGMPPTYTPLHRDPNPNIFVQLAGAKHVRLLAPGAGLAIFDRVRTQIGEKGGARNAAIRGEDMMRGSEKELLERAIWGKGFESIDSEQLDMAATQNRESEVKYGYEAIVNAGDGIFIPKGWWHSIKGVGDGITASVSAIYIRPLDCFDSTAQLVWSLLLIGILYAGQLVVSLVEGCPGV